MLGMSPEQVMHVYPDATIPTGTNEAEVRALQMKFIALGEIPSMVHFSFQEQRLYSVTWKLKPGLTYDATMPAYEELLDGLKRQHPPKRVTVNQRPLNLSAADRAKAAKWWLERMDGQTHAAKDEWDTVDGTQVSIQTLYPIGGDSVEIWVSTNGGSAWEKLQLESYEAKIRAKKAADMHRQGKFLDGLVGNKINALAAVWGAPTGSTKMPGGEVIYVWETQEAKGLNCRTSVFTRNKGLIYTWQLSGNACGHNS